LALPKLYFKLIGSRSIINLPLLRLRPTPIDDVNDNEASTCVPHAAVVITHNQFQYSVLIALLLLLLLFICL